MHSANHFIANEFSVAIDFGPGGSDYISLLFDGVHILELVGNLAFGYFSVGSEDEPEIGYLGIHSQVPDQTDVRTFRSGNRAYPSVVGRMDVADLKACPLSGQTTGTQSGQPSFVFQLGQWIMLVHKLGQLTGSEKFFQRRHERPGVYELGRKHGGRIGCAYPVLDDPLHPGKCDP